MEPQLDPSIRQQIEEFHRRQEANRDSYQKAIVLLARDRMMKDLDLLNEPPRPAGGLARAGGLFGRIGGQIRERVLSQRQKVVDPPEEDPSIIIIDAVPISTETTSPSPPEREGEKERRRLFDG